MNTVTIDGIEYIKASVLAKKLNYTSDYIGQLCRSNKVDAHLVGRTWYVHQASLNNHKDTRYAELRSNEKTSITNNKPAISRPEINAPVSKNTLKSHKQNFENRVPWRRPAYEKDAVGLLPDLRKPPTLEESFKITVDLAESEKLNVVSASHNAKLHSQPLPAVALSGTLKVQNFENRIQLPEIDNPIDKYSHNGDVDDSTLEFGQLSDDYTAVGDPTQAAREIHPTKVVGAKSKVKLHRFNTVTPAPESHPFIHHEPLPPPNHATRTHIRPLPPLKLPTRVSSGGQSGDTTSIISNLVILPAVLVILVVAVSLVSLEATATFNAKGEVSSSVHYTATLFEAL